MLASGDMHKPKKAIVHSAMLFLSRLKEPMTVVARLVVCHLTEEISHARRHPLACRCSVGGDHRPAPDWSTALVTGAGSRLNQMLTT